MTFMPAVRKKGGGGAACCGSREDPAAEARAVAAEAKARTALANEQTNKQAQERAIKALKVPDEGGLIKFLGLDALSCYTKDEVHKGQRTKLWSAWDYNGNGYLSLAEVDGHLRSDLEKKFPGEEGTKLWRRFKPCFIRAVKDASDVSPASVQGAVNSETGKPLDPDEYVTKTEFRVLLSYLRLYATMYEVFMFIDGGSSGIDKLDDAKISRAEWDAALPAVHAVADAWAPFVALKSASSDDFPAMDKDKGGAIILKEFCAWIKKKEIDAGTGTGKELSIGDDREDPAAKVVRASKKKGRAGGGASAKTIPADLAKFLALDALQLYQKGSEDLKAKRKKLFNTWCASPAWPNAQLRSPCDRAPLAAAAAVPCHACCRCRAMLCLLSLSLSLPCHAMPAAAAVPLHAVVPCYACYGCRCHAMPRLACCRAMLCLLLLPCHAMLAALPAVYACCRAMPCRCCVASRAVWCRWRATAVPHCCRVMQYCCRATLLMCVPAGQ